MTFNSEFTKVEDQEINDAMKVTFENEIKTMALKNWTKVNKATKTTPEETPFYRYILLGPVEYGKKEKRMHLHGYIYCNKQKGIRALKQHWGNKTHFDKAKGTGDQIEAYCLKGEHDKLFSKTNPDKRVKALFEIGERPQQGNRSDLETAIEECDTLGEFMDKNTELYCKYRNGLKDIYERRERKRPREYKPVEVIWNYGETGTGKTKMAFEDSECVNVDYNNGFFSQWDEAKVISLEEMNGQIPYKTLLKLLDGYHNYYNVNIKGGQKLIDLKRIYISSSIHPRDIYRQQEMKEGGIGQLLRRITKINHFMKDKIIDETNISNDELTNMDLC